VQDVLMNGNDQPAAGAAGQGTDGMPWSNNEEFKALKSRYFHPELMERLKPSAVPGEFEVRVDSAIENVPSGGVKVQD